MPTPDPSTGVPRPKENATPWDPTVGRNHHRSLGIGMLAWRGEGAGGRHRPVRLAPGCERSQCPLCPPQTAVFRENLHPRNGVNRLRQVKILCGCEAGHLAHKKHRGTSRIRNRPLAGWKGEGGGTDQSGSPHDVSAPSAPSVPSASFVRFFCSVRAFS